VEHLITTFIVLAVVPASAFLFGHIFLMKTMAHMQSRLGPMETGPHGILQLLADGLKFIGKEDLMPTGADKLVFRIAPVVAVVSTFLLFVVLPIGPDLVVADLDVGLLYLLAMATLSVIAVLMAGWGSASKYSLIGGLRAAGQLLAYEIPLVVAALAVVVQAGTLSLTGIVDAQSASYWFLVPQIVAFVIFMVAAQAELTQPPFDMPVADTEIVTGYQTEYSGFRFLLFYISEIATAVALSVLAVVLFLGGWHIPFVELSGTAANIVGPVVMLAKVLLVGFIIFWVRFSMPRLREDQLQSFAWKLLIPISLVNLAATAIFKVAL
jgi:NADH-quinone oxidoreductase subunit H